MTKEEYLKLLDQWGFPEPVEVQQPQNGYLDKHEHPFEVWALVIEGYIEIVVDSVRKIYYAGDIFKLGFKQAHSESYGPQGVKYLASRKS
jgi:uncharacterized cupin superfamily protein